MVLPTLAELVTGGLPGPRRVAGVGLLLGAHQAVPALLGLVYLVVPNPGYTWIWRLGSVVGLLMAVLLRPRVSSVSEAGERGVQ